MGSPHHYISMFRDFLTRNEIFFKTLATTFLSMAALYVAASQWNTAKEQRALAELQTRIAKVNALPQFDVLKHQIVNSETGQYDNNVVRISNNGGPVREFSAETIVLLKTSASRRIDPTKRKSLTDPLIQTVDMTLPLRGYFSAQSINGTAKGELTTFLGANNNSSFFKLVKSTQERSLEMGWDFFNIKPLIYVHTNYRDLLGDLHDDYYEVQHIGGSVRIGDDRWRAASSAWKTRSDIDLGTLTSEALFTEAQQAMATNANAPPKER